MNVAIVKDIINHINNDKYTDLLLVIILKGNQKEYSFRFRPQYDINIKIIKYDTLVINSHDTNCISYFDIENISLIKLE